MNKLDLATHYSGWHHHWLNTRVNTKLGALATKRPFPEKLLRPAAAARIRHHE
ncbi:hypothetical protein BAV2400 [Bordetella avium 197N]|uniref:Uncharacterized protein n=1 Tax=Bordetella avium (strain 197N) TaxID=360910 RepID=Q2KXX8_BORA1|nr:hypothetical protein BAV2400 [Bordetella avium 197N]